MYICREDNAKTIFKGGIFDFSLDNLFIKRLYLYLYLLMWYTTIIIEFNLFCVIVYDPHHNGMRV